LWWIYRDKPASDRWASVGWFLGSFVVGLLPSLVLFLNSPDAFLFNNLRYHAMRSSEGLVGWWWEKFVISLELFLWGGEGNGLQWSVLFFVGFGLAISGSMDRGYAGPDLLAANSRLRSVFLPVRSVFDCGCGMRCRRPV
jgi:hypothetical protein